VLEAGVLLLGLFAYVTVTGQTEWMIISPEMPFLGLVVWIFVGIASIIGGLLLIGSE